MNKAICLEVAGLSKRFGGLAANSDIHFSVEEGEIVSVIGPNGAGKSTLFNCVTGFYKPDGGKVSFFGKNITGMRPDKVCNLGIARTFQIVEVITEMELTIADKKRLEVSMALATQPRLLMLDEAMAGLTKVELREILDLIRKIRDEGMTLVIVEHVMEAVMQISDRVVVLNSGKKLMEGTPKEVCSDRLVIQAYLGEKYSANLK